MDIKERIDKLSEAEAKAALLKLCIEDGVAAYTFAERCKGTVEDYVIAILNGALAHGCGELRLTELTDEQLKKLKVMLEREPAHIHIEMDSPVRPLPCVRDENGYIRDQTVKSLFAKIDEELNEFKAAVLREVTTRNNLDDICDSVDDDTDTDIVDEAADVITAVTTLCEALCFDAEMRDDAQRRANVRNRERGRL